MDSIDGREDFDLFDECQRKRRALNMTLSGTNIYQTANNTTAYAIQPKLVLSLFRDYNEDWVLNKNEKTSY